MTQRTFLKLAVTLSLAALAGCQDRVWAEGGSIDAVATAAAETASAEPVPSAPAAKADPPQEIEPHDEPERVIDLDAELGVRRLVIARGVEGREPAGAAERFVAGEAERIYAFVEVGNRDRAESSIFVSFVRQGGIERGPIELAVGPSPRWRTWAYTRLATEPGVYHAVVRDGRGKELGRARFEVTPKDAPVLDPA